MDGEDNLVSHQSNIATPQSETEFATLDVDGAIGSASDLDAQDAKDLKSLEAYLKSLPYECESTAEMEVKLKVIVEKLSICVQTNNWGQSVGWDHMLQYWLIMRYPMPRAIRATLAKLYYELICSPAMEARLIRGWLDMFGRLLPYKSGSRPKLLPIELTLSWEKLWAALKKQVWSSASDSDDSLRSDAASFLTCAEIASNYYPPSDIPAMLDAILPLYNYQSATTVITILCSFVPPRHFDLYLPILFKLWESINSAQIDERILSTSSVLARECMFAWGASVSSGGDPIQDVGIFTDAQWARITRACLVSMNVPVGPSNTSTVSSTGATADTYQTNRLVKKGPSVITTLPTIFVYSIYLDGPIASSEVDSTEGYLAGSKALSSLRTIITSVETYFHPSNHGSWSATLISFVYKLAFEFATRWQEEHQPDSKTPVGRRLTPLMRKEFVELLKTPSLLAMFSKDIASIAFAQSGIKYLASLEPHIIMPAVLERAYNGFESINETHRVTAVLGALTAVSPFLASEKRWLGGQKHIVPLLELALPGVDINDPTKSFCALAFIASVLSHIKIGDLTKTVALHLGSDAPGEDAVMNDPEYDAEPDHLPNGFEEIAPPLDRDEERALARDSSAAFADWVISFFRKVFAVFEALPEEGGRSNKTGGKLEETLLKTIRSTVDIVAHHLSDHLFDLVLAVTFEYASTTVRANAVRAFGNLMSSLSKANSKKVIDKFLTFCANQILTELNHGASSVRTTAVGQAEPSDTTLHWHLAIIRGVIGNDGTQLLGYEDLLVKLLNALVTGTKNERGFSGTGRLVGRILSSITTMYPIEQRLLNADEWDNPRLGHDHNNLWGKLYRAKDVKINWHVPVEAEIKLTLRILDEVIEPALKTLNTLLRQPSGSRDSVWRNDFCRHIHVVRSAWGGLSALYVLPQSEPQDPYLDLNIEIPTLTAQSIAMKAGFPMRPGSSHYDRFLKHREAFGSFLHNASVSLRSEVVHEEGASGGEEHVDAILSVIRAIDTFLLDYAVTRSAYATQKKSYEVSRDLSTTHGKQKYFPRNVWIKRAQVYHISRVHTHSLYRRRTNVDELLLRDLLEFSLSSYTRARRNAQAGLLESVTYFIRTARILIDGTTQALAHESKRGKLADPDRQKGALYLLLNRSMATYAMNTPRYLAPFFDVLFSLRTQEKPSIQKLVSTAMEESIGQITAEAMDTSKTQFLPLPPTQQVISELEKLSGSFSKGLLKQVQNVAVVRDKHQTECYGKLRNIVLKFSRDSTLHWKYQNWAMVVLVQLIRRDGPTLPEIPSIFIDHIVSDHPTMRHAAQRGLVKVLRGVKARTFSRTPLDLWRNIRHNPLKVEADFESISDFVSRTSTSTSTAGSEMTFFDHIPNGPLVWKKTSPGYKAPPASRSSFNWEPASKSVLSAIEAKIDLPWLTRLVALWSQEGNRSNASTDLRLDNVYLIKHLVKIFEDAHFSILFSVVETVVSDADKFKQRAAAEILTGLIRGSKHLPYSKSKKLWDWFTPLLSEIFSKLTLDTTSIWESFITTTCQERDPRRVQPIVDFILGLKIDFQSESVFPLSKSMSWLLTLAECIGPRFSPHSQRIFDLYFQNLGTQYAEIRLSMVTTFLALLNDEWRPQYSGYEDLRNAIATKPDPLLLRDSRHMDRIGEFVSRLPELRKERLPGASVSQSLYDKISLTLLHWIWTVAYSPRAPFVFVYTIPLLPEILRMSELQDSSEVQQYSSGVLYILSSVNPPPEFIEPLTQVIIDAVESSSSWRIRHKALPVLAVWYFRNLPSLPAASVKRIVDVLVRCLSDENVEVREKATTTLSGVLRSGAEKSTVIAFKDKFARIAHRIRLPKRDDETYPDVLRKLHAAVLGMIATLQAYPYVVEPWMPALIERLARHASDPPPVSTAIRKFAAEFKKTHQDTWHIDIHQFDEDQSQALQTIVSGTSYYA